MTLASDIALAQELRERLYKLEDKIKRDSEKMRPLARQDHAEMVQMQARADDAYSAVLGRRAPPPLPGERPSEFQQRLLSDLQPFSTSWRRADLAECNQDMLRNIEADILSQALAAGKRGDHLKPGEVREVRSDDGQTTFIGKGAHFSQQFTRLWKRGRVDVDAAKLNAATIVERSLLIPTASAYEAALLRAVRKVEARTA